jgi:hypothetical protein
MGQSPWAIAGMRSDMALKPLPTGFGVPVPARSREERLMEKRVTLLLRAFDDAAKACGLTFAEGASLRVCADAILKAAKEAKLDPRLYEILWFVKKTA